LKEGPKAKKLVLMSLSEPGKYEPETGLRDANLSTLSYAEFFKSMGIC
jgi:hypothetical protein